MIHYHPPLRPPDFECRVYGTVAPAGSKRAVRAGGFARVIDANPKAAAWKQEIRQAAGREVRFLLTGPLYARFVFTRIRPANHYGKKGLRPSAPPYPTVKPDALKLARAAEDALTGIVYRDDSQIVDEHISKEYGEPEGVYIAIWRMDPDLIVSQPLTGCH